MRDSSWIVREKVLPGHGLVVFSVGSVLQHVGGVSVQINIEVRVGCALHVHDYFSLADDHLLHWQLLAEFDPRDDDV